jgi:anti-anti-sigma factor
MGHVANTIKDTAGTKTPILAKGTGRPGRRTVEHRFRDANLGEDFMEITVSDFGELGKRVSLVGRLDIPGAGKIDVPLKEIADSRTNIVVDLSAVNFIASLGMRSLVFAAKTLACNARTLVLLNPTPLVTDALIQAGLGHILPIVRSDEEARAALSRYSG